VVGTSRRSHYLRTVSAVLLADLLFSVMDMELKFLAAHYPAMQVAALRGLTSLPLVFLYVLWRRALPSLFKVRWQLHLLRAVLGIVMLSLFSYGLRTLPLSEAYAIFFVAPLMIAALSVLKEKVDASRWRAIAFGFLGVLVVLRPGFNHSFTMAGFAILATALCYAVSSLTVRIVAKTDSAESMVFWLMFSLALGAGALAWPEWVAVRSDDTMTLAGLAATGFLAQLLITYAYQHGEASAMAPFDYSALAWCAAIDWIVWHTLPDGWTWAGAALIVISGIYLVRRESMVLDSEHP